jgi:hypothetical protein
LEACQDRFCSVVSRAVGEDPAGTAPSHDLIALLEVPLPWEREIWKSRAFPPGLFDLGATAQERGIRLRILCVAPDSDYTQPGLRRVILLRRPTGWMATYDRREYLVPPAEVLELVRAALAGEALPGGLESGGVRDLLVCTHGSTDVACGRYGFPIYEQLRRRYASDRLRVWRVSHFGGHRFAPTMADLPDGRWWAHVDAEALERIATRSGPVSALRSHYRGWSGLATPFEQVLEREIFAQEGWSWTGLLKRSEVREQDPEGAWAEVALDYQSADGSRRGRYEGRVELSGQVMTALASGRELEAVPQYRVTRLARRDG